MPRFRPGHLPILVPVGVPCLALAAIAVARADDRSHPRGASDRGRLAPGAEEER